MPGLLPNFSEKRALIVHASDSNVDALLIQLTRLGIKTTVQMPARAQDFVTADMVFFDIDTGYDGMFPWKGAAPVPTIALCGSETPGRLEWAIRQDPSAYLLKPIGSKGVFQALVTAFHAFNLKTERDRQTAVLEDRLKMRPIVVQVVLRLMKSFSIDDDQAFRILRAEAMQRQISVEQCCHEIYGLATVPARLSTHLAGRTPGQTETR